MLFKEYGRAENDLGAWHDFGEDADTGKTVAFKLRDIPDHVDASIRKRLQIQRDGSMDLDMLKERAISVERCKYALLDSRNFEGAAQDQEGAEIYAKLIGRPLTMNEALSLDGKWTPELKEHVLRNQAWLRVWVIERLSALSKSRRSEESVAAKNS